MPPLFIYIEDNTRTPAPTPRGEGCASRCPSATPSSSSTWVPSRDSPGGREQKVEICGEARISEIARLPQDELEKLVILVNGHAAKPDTTVRSEDKITLLPRISGR